MRILVSGAGGFVGRHLVPHLRANDHEVIALKRGGDGIDGSFVGPSDLASIDRFPEWPAEIGAVVHLAALNPSRSDPASSELERLRRANVEATAALARRARREGVRRMVLIGSAAVHAPAGERPITEAEPLAPTTPYARSKAEGETAFWQALDDGGTEGVVLRPAPVFGPGAGNLTSALARLARTPLPLPLDGFGSARSLIAVDTLVEAIRLALTVPAARGKTLLVADDGPLAPAAIVSALREGAGRRAMILPAPVRLLRMASRLSGKSHLLTGAEQGLLIDNRQARMTLGWRPESASEALRTMARNGRL